ncbi:MAG: metallopeptidase TldD-related protein [Archangium sp.]|nr:metallopeptidase TldD-related protein [Archangium sp.]
MITEPAIVALCKSVLTLVKRVEPKAEAMVSAYATHRAHTRFARSELTTSGELDDLSLSLTVQLGLRSAAATSNQTDAASLRGLVERTIGIARLSPEQPETMPVLGATKVTKSALRDDAMAKLDAKGRADGIAQALAPSREKDLITAGFLQVYDGLIAQVTSAGLTITQPFTDADFSVTARTKDGTGSGWAALGTRQRAQLDFAAVGRTAAQKAIASAKPKTLEPGRYTVVLEPAAVGELFEYFTGSLDRRAVDEGRSPFAGKLGQKLVSELITLKSDPKTTPMLPFDGDGLALAPRTWVKAGVLESLAVSRYWAKEKKVEPTGSYSGFELAPGESSRAQLLTGIKRGVLITRFWYSNVVDPKTLAITALTRDGTFLIEDGVVTTPIKNFRINQSVIDALAMVDAVSSDRESPASAWKIPAMRTHEFLLASQSEAI